MKALQRVAAGVDRTFDALAGGLKQATIRFQRGASYLLLPRTRYDYQNAVGQGLNSSVVFPVIGWITRNFPQAKLRIRTSKVVGNKVTYDPVLPAITGPGALLRLWEYPNAFYDGTLMLQALLTEWCSTANAYLWKRRNDAGRVMELWWIPTWLIKPMWDDQGVDFISYYEYNPNGIPYRIPVEDIIHWRNGMDPQNPRLGLNPLAALAREIYTDDEASNYSATVLSNLGIPGVIISPKEAMGRNQVQDPESIKQSFKEKFSGDLRGEPLVLTAPTSVEILSFNPQQMQLVDLRRVPEERVSGAYGVPAIVAGLGAGLARSTFANFAEAREAGWEESLTSIGMSLTSCLKAQLLNEFVSDVTGYEMDMDTETVRVLQPDLDKIWTRALAALAGGGITRKRFKEIVHEDPDDAVDNVYYIPASLDVIAADTVTEALTPEEQREAENPLDLPPVEPAVAGGATNGNGNGNRTPTPVG